MKFIDFKFEMQRAEEMMGMNPDYWIGYKRGLCRNYLGVNFGTLEAHPNWLLKVLSPDDFIRDRGRGYIDGFKF